MVKGSSIPGTYFRLGYVKVPKIEEAFDSRNLLPSTAPDPNFLNCEKTVFFLTKCVIGDRFAAKLLARSTNLYDLW